MQAPEGEGSQTYTSTGENSNIEYVHQIPNHKYVNKIPAPEYVNKIPAPEYVNQIPAPEYANAWEDCHNKTAKGNKNFRWHWVNLIVVWETLSL